jgi:hypothetical protein
LLIARRISGGLAVASSSCDGGRDVGSCFFGAVENREVRACVEDGGLDERPDEWLDAVPGAQFRE